MILGCQPKKNFCNSQLLSVTKSPVWAAEAELVEEIEEEMEIIKREKKGGGEGGIPV